MGSSLKLCLVTEWQIFRALDFEQIKQQLAEPLIFDGRNVFEPKKMAIKGVNYISVVRHGFA